ncbi:MAG: radical SAM protein [Deltaproteobacteria bacterium]|nr:radical SAM protein [Deltaproteobacteria bacterium]MBW1949058.1 radical SAM protein [Deltaproteobacteria bacterium]MBW2007398.1 radical SAM protein [Deltaproteobacteria bacterium]
METGFESCRLCPRACGVDRRAGPGRCGETHRLRVAYVGPHFGEEPPITGDRGSGTVFFSGCGLRCLFCQNHQISRGGLGRYVGLGDLQRLIRGMLLRYGVHNINFVTPDHFAPHVFRLISGLRSRGAVPPVVFNVSGYQSIAMLKAAEPYVDIYLADYKYARESLARTLSAAPDYPGVALEAIAEMVRQKGFLSPARGAARRGVIVRHLVLPGHVENSIHALTSLYVEFGSELPLSLMSQYHPVDGAGSEAPRRFVEKKEFERVLAHARELGFETLFVQFPEKERMGIPRFFPDFRSPEPFGNQARRSRP